MLNHKILNPFGHLKRKRLPGMHLITACEGGAPLDNTLAAFFFMMLHDKVEHVCLTKEILGASEPHPENWAFEEWSYLSDNDAFLFLLLANMSTEQVQRWIASGSEKPFSIPHHGGNIVLRPDWTIGLFGNPGFGNRREMTEIINRLKAEVANKI